MHKKIMWGLGICASLALVLFSGREVFAQSMWSKTLLKSVDLLGVSVLRSNSMQFHLIDTTDQETSQIVTLPPIDNNDGLVYIVRSKNDNNQNYYGIVSAASGDLIDGESGEHVWVGDQGHDEFVMLMADETTGSWWIMGGGNID